MRESKKISERRQMQRKAQIKKRRKKRIMVIVVELIILSALGVTAFGMFKLGKLNHTSLGDDLVNNGLEQEGYTNIALFGTDNRAGEVEGVRSDCIIVASINNKTKEIKMISVYRDTLLLQEDDTFNKANSAYATGGPEAAINMLNKNLDLDIEDYVTVNFLALADVVDELGGLDLDLTYEEVVHMNNYCVETSEITGKDYERIEPEVAGNYHLNGVQAVSYSRIRYTSGGDFERTERQRLVLEKIAEKVKSSSLSTINKIIDKVLPEVSTSFTSSEIIKLAAGVFDYKIGETAGFPFDPATPDSIPGYTGSYVVPIGLVENVTKAHEFLFPDEKYEPTETVKSINNELFDITGIGPGWVDGADIGSDSYDDGSYDDSYDDGSYDDGSYDDGSYDDGSYDDGAYDDSSYDDGSYDDGYYEEDYYDYTDEDYYVEEQYE